MKDDPRISSAERAFHMSDELDNLLSACNDDELLNTIQRTHDRLVADETAVGEDQAHLMLSQPVRHLLQFLCHACIQVAMRRELLARCVDYKRAPPTFNSTDVLLMAKDAKLIAIACELLGNTRMTEAMDVIVDWARREAEHLDHPDSQAQIVPDTPEEIVEQQGQTGGKLVVDAGAFQTVLAWLSKQPCNCNGECADDCPVQLARCALVKFKLPCAPVKGCAW